MKKRFKPLPSLTFDSLTAEERNKFTVHAEQLSKEDIKDYLDLDWTEQSSYSAWLMKFYNDTDTMHSINSQSWSINRIKENEIAELIKQRYEYANTIKDVAQTTLLVTAVASSTTLAAELTANLILFIISFGLLVPTAVSINEHALILLTVASAGAFIVPIINWSYIKYCINQHTDALNKYLLLPRFSIAAHSTLQGIVLLDRDALYEPWSLTVYDKYDQEQSFRFSTI
jgi:hypothetical protein